VDNDFNSRVTDAGEARVADGDPKSAELSGAGEHTREMSERGEVRLSRQAKARFEYQSGI